MACVKILDIVGLEWSWDSDDAASFVGERA